MIKRLEALKACYQGESHVWDVGCDHGLLGSSFLHEPRVQKIFLVDPSLDVFDKLKDTYITVGKIKLIYSKGQDLKIETKNNLIFIAGMGGREIGEIILSLLPLLQSCSRFVISPHRKILELRSLLRELPLKLEKEEVVWDKGQFYVILSLKPDITGEKKVSLFGDDLWQSEAGEHYRQQQIQFFSLHKDEKSQQYIDFLKHRRPPSSP